tara:strand:+ start:40388 stop:41425 length:1038 start_codon:yes stop_codon:yes gene_type:complete
MTCQVEFRERADFEAALRDLPGPDRDACAFARARQDSLTKPRGALGKLEDLSVFLAGWQARRMPRLEKVSCLVFAGNHGVVAQGISAYPAEVTRQMVRNFEEGGAAINQLCQLAEASLQVIALELDQQTRDFTCEAAMTEAEVCAALNAGAAAVPVTADCLLLGEMGIGNTTAAAALSLSLFGGQAEDWVGPGTGLKGERLRHKARVVAEAVRRHNGHELETFDLLRCLGGRELAAIAGAVIAARHRRIPVLLDGFISTAAAAVLTRVTPDSLDHTLLSHLSAEPGHRHLAEALNKEPILHLDLRLGEASGAAIALMILRAALATYAGMASFDEARVSREEAEND